MPHTPPPRRPLKLAFSDFWPGFHSTNNYLFQLLGKYYDVVLDERPDFLIYSGFGRRHRSFDCTRIFWTGENVAPDFDACDYAFTHEYLDDPRHYRLPLYAYYHDPRDPNDPCHPEQLTRPKPPAEELLRRKTKFCCALISNPNAHERLAFMRELSRYKRVDSGGKAANNLGYVVPLSVGGKSGKLAFIQDYKFVLAFENASHPGYTTEKVLEPMAVHSIPIYWGNPLVGRDFNTRSFVNCHDYPSPAASIQRIIALDRDDASYQELWREPYFHQNRVNEFVAEQNVIQQFERIFAAPAPRSLRRRALSLGWRASYALAPAPLLALSSAARNRLRLARAERPRSAQP